jgi:hypothetical protein
MTYSTDPSSVVAAELPTWVDGYFFLTEMPLMAREGKGLKRHGTVAAHSCVIIPYTLPLARHLK